MSYDSVSCIQDYELKKGVLVVVSIIFIVFYIAEQLFMATYIVYYYRVYVSIFFKINS